MNRLNRAKAFLACCLLSATITPAVSAENFPTRPVTIVVPFSAGGATDVVARLLANEVSADLGQAVIVDNKAGAAGAIGAAFVTRAAPDGYTLCFCGGGPLVLLKLLEKKLPYDPNRDFTPITLTHIVDYVVGVPVQSPIKSVSDLVAAAKAKPDQLSYASTGIGGPAHLGEEMFNRMAGVQINHVPYKGESQFIPDLVTGQLTVGIFSAQLGDQMEKAGKTRLIGAWSAQRLAILPKLPTVAEQGFPAFSAFTFVGVTAPRGTPAPVVDVLNTAFVKAVNKPAIKAKMTELGFTPMGNTPAAFGAFLQREEVKWGKVVDDLGLRGSM